MARIYLYLNILCIISFISVFAQQKPYGGTPWQIPGTIEAENYDQGGEGTAYHDSDSGNSGSQYRNDDVDIESCSEGGYNVGWIVAGEWIDYSVDVITAGNYKIRVRAAANMDGGQIHFSFKDKDVTGVKTVPNTGGWQQWVWLEFTGVQLESGNQVMRMVFDNSGFNVNCIQLIKQIDTQYPSVSLTSPKNGEEYKVGDRIPLSADASDTDGSVQNVEFFQNGNSIIKDLASPYDATWIPFSPGVIKIYAIATDNMGAVTISDTVQIEVKKGKLKDSPDYSVKHGFYNSPFDLTISHDSAGCSIRYTLDGSDPKISPTSYELMSPAIISIDPSSTFGRSTTPAVTVRAFATIDNIPLTEVGSNTYIFPEKVKTQKYPGGEWPERVVNTKILDYEMDPDVVNDPRYKAHITEALLDIPSICINTDLKNLFDPAIGIYVNPTGRGKEWERPVSIELIDPKNNEKGFQINAGLRIRGGYSRIPTYESGQYKHAFRLFFRDEYGKSKLKYSLFGKEGVDEFESVDLRTAQNYSWSYRDYSGHAGIFIRDIFSRDCQRDMGQPYTRGRAYHLYINGMYWGLYQTEERPEASYAESYFGGNKDNYDVIKVDTESGRGIEATDGTLDAYNQLWSFTNSGFSKNEDYFKIQGKNADGTVNLNLPVYANLDNLIDYMLLIFYTGNFDAPITAFANNTAPNNFYGIRNKIDRSGYMFFSHDAEHSIMDPTYSENSDYGYDRTGTYTCGFSVEYFNPQWLHQKLAANTEYKMLFADHVYRHFFNNGALTPAASIQRFSNRRDEINMAVIAESARWGDTKVDKPRTKDDDWLPSINWVLDSFFPTRTDIVLQQLKDKGWYPKIDPPVIYSGSEEITENRIYINSGNKIKLSNLNGSAAGTIYYTVDGSDPRVIGGNPSASAFNGGTESEITITSNTVLRTRIKNGDRWSALHEMFINTGETNDGLKITEIHYNPLPDGDIGGSEFEFLEFKNIGSSPIYLAGDSFIKGIEYTFPDSAKILPNHFLVLASNASMFGKRYGFAPYAQYNHRLDNSGEHIILVNIKGDTLISARYNDKSPWPEEADSAGYSLVARNVNGIGDPSQAEYWHASSKINGSPLADDLISSADQSDLHVPLNYYLNQNYPNPFNPETVISYQIPEMNHVELKVFDILGREVAALVNKELKPGKYQVKFDGSNLSSGLYIYRIRAGNFISAKKMMLIR